MKSKTSPNDCKHHVVDHVVFDEYGTCAYFDTASGGTSCNVTKSLPSSCAQKAIFKIEINAHVMKIIYFKGSI